MYILNDFFKALRLFVQTHAELDIDIKFPTSKHHINGHIRFYSTKNLQNLVEKLVEDLIIVECCSWSSNYLSIWLKKEVWASTVMKEILMSGCKYGSNDDHKDTAVSVSSDESNDSVTCLRIVLLKEAIQNLAKMNGFIIGNDGLNLLVSKKNNPTNRNLILCGNVVCNMPVKEYKQQKQDSITKMSANRIESNEYPVDIISKLCHASIVYELLSVRHNKVINTECDTSNKDSGIFIMYNYSRLCQIWKAYQQDVIGNYHDYLPDIDSVNFGLLTSNEEWILIFNYLSMYPLVIQQSVKHLMSANVDIHRLCKFLMEMSSAVSLFYHRYHILSSPLPLMNARIYLVKTSIQVYENVFQLLGIKAVREM
ncbi:DALR anticodon-binding domain-containing protein 3-like [Melanaphis sacchari]|uniref:DALR anticodon-binding domain-containing protein 3-like n=1 Tax=Melanaphis sacchari TaxID=742174 RepID=UPI000DC15A02|nr:DALR anticodon-binding domain-containing protein 3-like [Melanaphis sacchari]XP_025197576.1 DALR anticodon-binding domain-containing protein 3-like [Melanaphis sacchari]XP_025197577.1 DALR anticodon-binding domain-containing protein 3-like [Melanaphis sacchari]XP_025197578.1 DALR anticodon-binding domain-containing protein 3-like [Melanaphis sacchari]XP_025197579.1 DALR anticodon-binding domain-containing protein 3-like [Melanaphis sacchari]